MRRYAAIQSLATGVLLAAGCQCAAVVTGESGAAVAPLVRGALLWVRVPPRAAAIGALVALHLPDMVLVSTVGLLVGLLARKPGCTGGAFLAGYLLWEVASAVPYYTTLSPARAPVLHVGLAAGGPALLGGLSLLVGQGL